MTEQRKNLHANTAPGCNYPSYVSVNTIPGTRDVEIIVRGEAKPVEGEPTIREGAVATKVLKPEEFGQLAHDLYLAALAMGVGPMTRG